MSIFRAYDIRGVYPKDINEEIFMKIAVAFQNITKGKNLVVGADARLSSPKLKAAFSQGLVDSGASAIDIGIVPTPLVYFGIAHYGKDGGAMITASHNPPEYNGVKLCRKSSMPLTYETGIQEIENIVKSNKKFETKKGGEILDEDIVDDYMDWVLSKVKLYKPLKVVIDCGNGICGQFAPEIFQEFGCKVFELFCDVDGTYPNHHPDPTKEENIRDLKKEVIKRKADLGIAFDGDGDRALFVDEKGNGVTGDISLSIFAKNILTDSPGAKIIFEVKSSRALIETIEKYEGKGIMSRVGYSYIRDRLVREKAVLAGEVSGHFYFAENYGYDDAMFAALKMAQIVSEHKKLSELVKEIPHYYATPEIRKHCPDEKKFGLIKKITEKVSNKGLEVVTLDGARVEFPDGWALIRASNTEPAIVMRCEASTKKRLNEIKRFLDKEMKNFL